MKEEEEDFDELLTWIDGDGEISQEFVDMMLEGAMEEVDRYFRSGLNDIVIK